MTTSTETTIDDRVIKAIAHPLRQRLLHRLGKGVASPRQLAAELNEPLNSVSYHVKILEKFGAIELVETREVRGRLIEHFYRATTRPWIDEEHWTLLPLATQRAFFDHLLQQIWEHVLAAAAEERLDDPKTHVTWTHLQLDDEGYEELSEELNRLLDRALELEAEAAVRLAEAGGEADIHKTELAILHYHRAVSEKKTSPRKKQSRANSAK